LSKKPTKIWFLIAFIVLVVGIGLAALVGYSTYSEFNDGTKLTLPETKEVDLESGSYTVFYDYEGAYNLEDYQNVMFRIDNVESNEPVQLDQPTMNSNYSFGGRSGIAVLTFEIENEGTYRIQIYENEGQETDRTPDFVILSGFGKNVGSIVVAIFILIGAASLAGLIVLITIIRIVIYNKRENNI
jgi:preprotein translocase subunit SecF